jgi:hypothetical protein
MVPSTQPGAVCPTIFYNFHDPGQYVEWTLPSNIARQQARIDFHYLDGVGRPAQARIVVGGVSQDVSFPTTVDWYSWAHFTVDAMVGPGMVIHIEWRGPSGETRNLSTNSSLNIDQVVVRAV